ncbi:hypothetical protein CRUP_026666 [Coryphaenoides rupestris]|nr:hypothetical protein CRUP_026666 [Coryphaenoides rupestris]
MKKQQQRITMVFEGQKIAADFVDITQSAEIKDKMRMVYSRASSSSFRNTSWPRLGGRAAWKRLQSPLHRIQGSTSTLKWSSGENSLLIRFGVPAPFPRQCCAASVDAASESAERMQERADGLYTSRRSRGPLASRQRKGRPRASS